MPTTKCTHAICNKVLDETRVTEEEVTFVLECMVEQGIVIKIGDRYVYTQGREN